LRTYITERVYVSSHQSLFQKSISRLCSRQQWQQDCSAATQNLLLAAEALGLGAVWTGVYPDPERSSKLSALLQLPGNVQPLCAIPIGHHDGTTQPKDKWKPENIQYGKW